MQNKTGTQENSKGQIQNSIYRNTTVKFDKSSGLRFVSKQSLQHPRNLDKSKRIVKKKTCLLTPRKNWMKLWRCWRGWCSCWCWGAEFLHSLQRNTLHYIALHCTALHCTAQHYTALHCTALHCFELYSVLESSSLYHSVVRCSKVHCVNFIFDVKYIWR